MIGRAAQGRPWIFREIDHFLVTGEELPPPTVAEARALILEHLADHYAFHGEEGGVRTARKHLGWYTEALSGGADFRREVNAALTTATQIAIVASYFDRLADESDRLVYETRRPEGADIRSLQKAGHATTRTSAPWVGEALAA